jgi:hypothetical protein
MHTAYPLNALSLMAIDRPTEQDIIDLFDALTPLRTRDEGIMARNMAFRLSGKTTGRLNIEPADNRPESDDLWYPGGNR